MRDVEQPSFVVGEPSLQEVQNHVSMRDVGQRYNQVSPGPKIAFKALKNFVWPLQMLEYITHDDDIEGASTESIDLQERFNVSREHALTIWFCDTGSFLIDLNPGHLIPPLLQDAGHVAGRGADFQHDFV